MVSSSTARSKAQRRKLGRPVVEIERRKIAVLGAVLGAFAVIEGFTSKTTPSPKHTSILTGRAWLDELIEGHPGRFREQLGISKPLFRMLCRELQSDFGLTDSKYVTAQEKLAIFLYLGRTGASNRILQERFQRSGETISRHIRDVLNLIVTDFYGKYVRLPAEQTPPEIRENPKLYPFLKDTLGAADGSHFDKWCHESNIPTHRDRKGRLSENVLAICDFSMRFLYVLPGWEGSAADSTVWDYARSTDLRIPQGKYYLADAGFPNCNSLLVPYRGVRYHLAEWGRANQRPKNREELFNLRHAQARNVIERIFGVFKRRFGLLSKATEYPEEIQSKFICAFAAIHNYIRIHEPDDTTPSVYTSDGEGRQRESEIRGIQLGQEGSGDMLGSYISRAEKMEATARRDRIAQEMWEQYQQVLAEREQDI